MEIKYIESAARVLNRDFVNKGGLDISKNVLWVKGQQIYELSKVEVKKKFCRAAGLEPE